MSSTGVADEAAAQSMACVRQPGVAAAQLSGASAPRRRHERKGHANIALCRHGGLDLLPSTTSRQPRDAPAVQGRSCIQGHTHRRLNCRRRRRRAAAAAVAVVAAVTGAQRRTRRSVVVCVADRRPLELPGASPCPTVGPPSALAATIS